MDAHEHADSLEDAHAHALRRIQELREREEAPPSAAADLRGLLTRAEGHVGELRGSAQELAALLPTRVEAAVARALGEDEGGLGRRLDEVRGEVFATAEAVDRIERDLLAERLGRVEDLEVLVDLVTGGLAAVRADIARIGARVGELERRLDLDRLSAQIAGLDRRLDEPLRLTVERASANGVRSLFAPTERTAGTSPAPGAGPAPVSGAGSRAPVERGAGFGA